MSRKPRINIAGNKYGRLTVLSFVKTEKAEYRWNCICDCGKTSIVESSHLKAGSIKSCGCLKTDSLTKHGHTSGYKKSPEYSTYQAMIARCYDINHKSYKRYGGRGIRVCKRWLKSFENFLKDMGLKPSAKHSLDRKKVNGNYTKPNCRWATEYEQQRNKRTNVWYEVYGKKYVQFDLCDLLKVEYRVLKRKLNNNWTLEQIFDHYMNKKTNDYLAG